mmetsp:Transcript_26712/g.56870  ORF Transcript_26712/g.56870 Transcript_26712/m.56870 type:complete len:254 (-) Transcript_26712:1725-2486(-)
MMGIMIFCRRSKTRSTSILAVAMGKMLMTTSPTGMRQEAIAIPVIFIDERNDQLVRSGTIGGNAATAAVPPVPLPDCDGFVRSHSNFRLPILQDVQSEEDVDSLGDGPFEDGEGRSFHLDRGGIPASVVVRVIASVVMIIIFVIRIIPAACGIGCSVRGVPAISQDEVDVPCGNPSEDFAMSHSGGSAGISPIHEMENPGPSRRRCGNDGDLGSGVYVGGYGCFFDMVIMRMEGRMSKSMASNLIAIAVVTVS